MGNRASILFLTVIGFRRPSICTGTAMPYPTG